MPNWDRAYADSLTERFDQTLDGLSDRLDDVARGRVVPAVEDIAIGSGRAVDAAVLFFDIRDFTGRSGSFMPDDLKTSLLLLDCVIPMVMHIVHDFGGYVEKNTGDGVMAVIGIGKTYTEAANASLDIATTTFHAIDKIINPAIAAIGLQPVSARIGINMGSMLLARIGLPTGAARIDRSFLTAVGPAANLASKLQGMAGTNEIWCGDLVRANAHASRQQFFLDVTPSPWPWTYYSVETGLNTYAPYQIWRYAAVRRELPPPIDVAALRRFLGR